MRITKRGQADEKMLKGTFDMMILRTLAGGGAHGHRIAKIIERASEDVLKVEQGSLYPRSIGWKIVRLEDRKAGRSQLDLALLRHK